MNKVKGFVGKLIVFLLMLILVTQSTLEPADSYERARAYTRSFEFNYVDWTLEALRIKNIQESVAAPRYMSIADQRRVVFEYLRLVRWVNQTNSRVNRIYANPDIENPDQAAADLSKQLRILRGMEESLQPLAESVLQYQVSTVVAELGLGLGGQPVPPVMYHVTRLPYALIVSPRDVIRQDADISLTPALTTAEIIELEERVSQNMNVSALVVNIGGVGIYPTMVMSTTDLDWLLEVVSHEWTHNFLTLRPLGLGYMASGQMRTINETTANISGKEIGQAVMERYYPEMAPPRATEAPKSKQPKPTPTPEDPNVFSFNREMRKTRVQVDQMLKEGKIKEAEDYMEQRRRFFWDNGYQIRKLNQAYFAFYGAYSDAPGGGAAGADPVGPTVQLLREQSSSLAEFLNRISWVTSFDELRKLVPQ